MPRISTGEPRSRLSLEFSERVRERLERLRHETEADTLSETIRRALAIYEALWEARKDGAQIVARLPDGTERIVLIL